jgi:hypothetical protein
MDLTLAGEQWISVYQIALIYVKVRMDVELAEREKHTFVLTQRHKMETILATVSC